MVQMRLTHLANRDNMRVAFDARKSGKHGKRRRAQIDRLPPRLAIGQKEYASLEIDMLPLGMK